MNRSRFLVCSFALLGLALASVTTTTPASAEGFLDLYLGASFPEDGDVDARVSTQAFPASAVTVSGRIDYDTSFTSGLRGGYWFEDTANFIGLGLDLSYYGAYEDTSTAPIDIVALPITPLLMARIPIAVEEDFPGGRVQPYAAIGPGLTLSVARADLSELGLGIDDLVDASFDVGLDVRGGLAIHIAKPIAIFAEYRYTRLRPEYGDEVDYNFGPDIDIDIEPDLDVHHMVFGVSFRF